MPQRQHIVTLSDTDTRTLDQVLNKTPVEKLMQALRTELNEGLDEVRALRKTRAITVEQAQAARTALQRRSERIAALPDTLVDSHVREAAAAPITAALQLCEQLLTDYLPEDESHDHTADLTHSPAQIAV